METFVNRIRYILYIKLFLDQNAKTLTQNNGINIVAIHLKLQSFFANVPIQGINCSKLICAFSYVINIFNATVISHCKSTDTANDGIRLFY